MGGTHEPWRAQLASRHLQIGTVETRLAALCHPAALLAVETPRTRLPRHPVDRLTARCSSVTHEPFSVYKSLNDFYDFLP